MKNKIIVIDPGHGGHDPGGAANGLKEKDLVLDIGLEVGRILKSKGIRVVYTRTTDVFISLSKRAEMANEVGADIFISIHTNAGGGASANGVEVFSYPGSNQSMELSKVVLNQMLEEGPFKVNRGNKTANFAVLRRTKMTAILTESGFIDHAGDAQKLRTQKKQISSSIANGVLKYLNIPFNSTSKPKNYIEVGDRGEKVKELQKNLNHFGWNAGPEDGIAGKQTDKAIRDFQRAHGLAVDGKFGPSSYKILNDALAAQKENKPKPPVVDSGPHFAEKDYKELNENGIKIHEKRFDDPLTRGELFVIANQIVKKKMI